MPGMSPTPFLMGLGHKSKTPVDDASSVSPTSNTEMAAMYERYKQMIQHDIDRNDFIAQLLARHEYLTQQNQVLTSERKRDREWMLSWQTEKQQYEAVFENMQQIIAENPFVMILIDGNGMIFLEELVRDGAEGGRRAAFELYAAVQVYIEREAQDVPLDAHIVCRVYANVGKLSETFVEAGVIEDTTRLDEFVHGFTSASNKKTTLFDFIDVGTGESSVNEKITENFVFFAQDYRCRRLLFGCSHDNGYARFLGDYSNKREIINKVTLLGGVPFRNDQSTTYTTKEFPCLLRDSGTIEWGSPTFLDSRPGTLDGYGVADQKNFNVLGGLPTRFPAPARSLMDSPIPPRAAMMHLPRTPSTSTLASDGASVTKSLPGMGSWASKAAAPAPPLSEIPAYRPADREELIARNRAGQRVDPPCRDYDKTEVDRMKRMKMCNVHYLRQECPYDKQCTHTHSYKPSREELGYLRLVARMAPCQNGSGCQDIKCIYGHRCPAPSHRTNSIKGTKSCIFGEQCKFPPELHDIDTNVVKTLVIR